MERILGSWPQVIERSCANPLCTHIFREPFGSEETLCPKCKPRGYDNDVSVSNPSAGTYSVGTIRTGVQRMLGMLRLKGID